jgi:hypothetical protein
VAAAVVVAAEVAVVAQVAVAAAAPAALPAVRPSDIAASAEARRFRLHDKVEDIIGRARSSDPANSCVWRLAVLSAANNFRIHRKMLTRQPCCRAGQSCAHHVIA